MEIFHWQDGEARSMKYGFRPGAEEFPLQIVLSIIYPCNLGCPYCPYTDGNSEIRKFYHERNADLFPPELFRKIADECAPYHAFIRCTGGGEPTLHPQMIELTEYAKKAGSRIWMNTNGALLGPHTPKTKKNLERLIDCGCDLIEFSVDAGDGETYNIVRPPRKGDTTEARWLQLIETVRYGLNYRSKIKSPTKIVCSIIMHDLIKDKIDQAAQFWLSDVGVDELIKRKYLTWDDNTSLEFAHSADPDLYAGEREEHPPCVWPFERMNVDTLGRVALCGQDISFRTSDQFPNVRNHTIKDIWQGEVFRRYRSKHLSGRGDEIQPCSSCSAWKAGIRDWKHGWLKVLNTAEKHRRSALQLADVYEVGAETELIRRKEKESDSWAPGI